MSTVEKFEKMGEKVGEVVENMGEEAKDAYKMTEHIFVDSYKKIEETVVDGFNKMADGFVEKHLMKEGETVEEARERIAKETAAMQEKAKNAGKINK